MKVFATNNFPNKYLSITWKNSSLRLKNNEKSTVPSVYHYLTCDKNVDNVVFANMTWFQSVVNTVREVTKAINKVTGSVIDQRSAALPFKDDTSRKSRSGASGNVDNDSDSENDNAGYDTSGEGTSQSASAARISTRARITYELDRYQKNAMLVFVQMLSDPPSGCRIVQLTNEEVGKLVDSFANFRFEVDVHVDLTCSQLEQKCAEFFQRDFRKYGTVVVMVLSFDGTNGQLSAFDGRFSESVILRHLTDDLNPTLIGKPKIYITEANRSGNLVFMGRRYQHSLPLEEHHQDVLGLHIPCNDIGTVTRRPLLLLSDNINEMGDSNDFVNILKKTMDDATKLNCMFEDVPIELSNNLSKEMRLARS